MKNNLFILLLLICLLIPLMATAQTVYIPDPNLRAVMGYTVGDNLSNITSLYGYDRNISNLTGLEHAINLEDLSLQKGNISNLSPLAGLTKLTHMNLGGNSISDISPLAGLTNLTYLGLISTRYQTSHHCGLDKPDRPAPC